MYSGVTVGDRIQLVYKGNRKAPADITDTIGTVVKIERNEYYSGKDKVYIKADDGTTDWVTLPNEMFYTTVTPKHIVKWKKRSEGKK